MIENSQALAARVQRYHAYPVRHSQSTGEHSHRVITMYIQLFGIPRAEVLAYIAFHDLGEYYSGDIPFGAKRDNPKLKEASNEAEETGLCKLGIKLPELTEIEWKQFKLVDLLEMYEFAVIENMQGNMFARNIMYNVEKAVTKFCQGNTPLYQLATTRLMKIQAELNHG